MGRGGGGGAPGGTPDSQLRQYGDAGPERHAAGQYETDSTGSQRQAARYENNDISSPQNTAPDGSNTSTPRQTSPDGTGMTGQQQAPPGGGNMTGPPQGAPGGANMPGGSDPRAESRQGQMPNAGGGAFQGNRGGGMFNTGSAGPLRLFQSELSGQISWLLPFAIIASIGLLAGVRRRIQLTARQEDTLFWLAWLVPGMVFFSVAGFFHQYYLIMLAPPIAALTGAGAVELWNLYRDNDGWKRWLLPAAVLATTALQVYILYPYQRTIGMAWPAGVGIAGVVVALALCLAVKKQKIATFAAAAAVAVLLAAPFFWSATPLLYGDNSQLPAAGPSQQGFGGRGQGWSGGGAASSVIDTKLYQYVKSHNTGETYLFATTDTNTAETYIIQTGEAVMPMGGFNDSADEILAVEKLEQMVADKKVKFFLLGSGGMGGGRGGSGDVASWIIANSTEVPIEEWQGGSAAQSGSMGGFTGGGTLYEINTGDDWQ
jgi:4-amino-4-deoxy-L-arabinose transferase-like glycosyltransferase